jgi:FkbM family methyltransferase
MTNLPHYWRVFGIKGMMSYARIRYGSPRKLHQHYLRGIARPVYLRGHATDTGTMREVFFDRDYDIQTGRTINVIVDAGANVGLTSVFFANKYPAATIFAIEPEEGNFSLLKKNVAHYPQVIPIHAALWNHSGGIQLSDPGRGEHGFVTGEALEISDVSARSVPSVTLSDLMLQFGISRIDLLKVDIEGAEKEVFESSGAWIAKVDMIIVELHERFKPGCADAVRGGAHEMRLVREIGKLIVLQRETC